MRFTLTPRSDADAAAEQDSCAHILGVAGSPRESSLRASDQWKHGVGAEGVEPPTFACKGETTCWSDH